MSTLSITPLTEAARLACLASYQLSNSLKDEVLDSIVRMASVIFKTPIAMVSFLEPERLMVKSVVGLDITQVESQDTFCHLALQEDGLFEIPDALESPLFAENPLVKGPLHLRFYAGTPLTTKEGFRLGTLCIADTEAKLLSEEERHLLQSLAQQVMTRLDLNLREYELEKRTKSVEAYAKKLETHRTELDQIAYAVAHELKSPLRAIHNLSEWVSEELQEVPSPEVKSNLLLMRNRVHRLENLFNGLLGYFNAFKTSASPEEVSLFGLVSSLTASLQKTFPFQISIAPDLPVLFTDRNVLQAIFAHLLKNAVQHNPLPHLHIQIGWEYLDDSKLIFHVGDNGHGILPQYQEQVFGIFKTIPQSHQAESTGIGLPLIRKLLQEKDEKIWVESRANQGSRFSFTWAA